jgi:hypothetical protein
MKKSALLALCLLLASCAMQDVTRYQAAEPKLDLLSYFIGHTEAWGMFQKHDGEVARRFHVDITGSLQDGALMLDERFHYDDGSSAQRVWTLKRQADGRWLGRAADVKGEAIGEIAGNALHWKYTLLLPVDGSTYEMQFDDWMFLIDGSTMINRASMRKFGIEFGQVTLFFRKQT